MHSPATNTSPTTQYPESLVRAYRRADRLAEREQAMASHAERYQVVVHVTAETLDRLKTQSLYLNTKFTRGQYQKINN